MFLPRPTTARLPLGRYFRVPSSSSRSARLYSLNPSPHRPTIVETATSRPLTTPPKAPSQTSAGVSTLAYPAVLNLPPMATSRSDTVKKAHHNPKGGFVNPWPSHQHFGFLQVFTAMVRDWNVKTSLFIPKEEELVPVVPMDWSMLREPDPTQLQLTWLGHASFLLQANGLNILFDPVFSARCSPVQFVGPKRIRPTPCTVAELPPIDLVVISHNHYDHMDVETIRALGSRPHYIVPLGNKQWLEDLGATRVTEMDWWDESNLDLLSAGGSSATSTTATPEETPAPTTTEPRRGQVQVVCTPCQHFTGRGLTDRYRTLWASFCLVFPSGQRFYFAGDTGYRTVTSRAHEATLDQPDDPTPVCPAFKEIGDRYGPFDLACIPIGAYSPRWVFSPVHCSPEDAVRVHEDVRARKSVAMHWGTFILTDETLNEPPERLAAALKNRGHQPDAFSTMDIGATMVAPATEPRSADL